MQLGRQQPDAWRGNPGWERHGFHVATCGRGTNVYVQRCSRLCRLLDVHGLEPSVYGATVRMGFATVGWWSRGQRGSTQAFRHGGHAGFEVALRFSTPKMYKADAQLHAWGTVLVMNR